MPKIQKWGNSLVVRIPSALADQLDICAGMAVDVSIKNGPILVSPKKRPKYRLTRQIKGYPFEVPVDDEEPESAVLADHVRNVDWRGRRVPLIRAAPAEVLEEVVARLEALVIEPESP